jgi:biotin carboxyl carrier protein
MMLADRDGHVKVRANVAGEVEIRVNVGDVVVRSQAIAVVEGDHEIESLSVRQTATVVDIHVASGDEVEEGAVLMTVLEME